MMSASQCLLPANLSSLPQATGFVADFGAGAGLTANDVLRLTLIVEELFTNTVQHGLGGRDDVQVRLALAAGPQRVTVVYEDSAAAFDPLSRLDEAQTAVEAAVEERKASGIGLLLATQMTERASYAREGGWNRLTLTLPRER